MRYTAPICGMALSLACLLTIASTSLAQVEPKQDKALRYHAALLRRPNPGYLFDRFYNTWLDAGTLEELRSFLQERVDDRGETADRLLLAYFHAKQGDDVKALEEFREALENDPENAEAGYQKAVVEARTLDFDTAIADLETALQSEPDEKTAVKIAKLQGRLHVRNRQTDKALKTWKQLLEANPTDENLYEDIVELEMSEGLYDEAAELSEKLIDRTTDKYKQVIRRVRLGDIYQRAGKRTKALEVYGATLGQVGDGTWLEREILAQIEQLFRREDDLAGLQQHYQRLLEDYSRRVQVRKQYARLLLDLNARDEAVSQFEEILKLTPGNRENVEAYVAVLAETDQLPQAVKVLEALIKQQPRDAELRLRLAALEHKGGDSQAAADAVQQYLEVAEKSQYTYLRAARTLKQLELLDQAERTYQELTDAYPDSIAAQEARAAFLYEREKKDKALAIWRKLAAGQDRNALVHAARLMAAHNEHQAAFDLLKPRYEEFSNDPIYITQLVQEAVVLDRHAEALPWALRRVQLARSATEMESAVAQAAQISDKAEKTPELIRQLAADDRRSVQETCLLAELYEATGDSRQAEEVLSNVEDQQDLLVIAEQIRLHTRRRDWDKAAAATRRLVESPAGRKSVYVRRLVELYERDMQLDEALRFTQEWKKLSPGSTTPWLSEARLLGMQGKDDEAIDVLRAAALQFDDDADVRAKLAQTYAAGGKLADAERIYWRLYEDAEDLSGKLRWVQQLAESAELQGKSQQLVEKFEERQRSNRASIEPLLALAEIHRASSNYEEQRKALLEAARLKSDSLPLLHQIARIEEEQGDWQRALATLQRAAKLDKTTGTQEKIARLYLNYGDVEKGYAILYEAAGNQTTDARSAEAIAKAMIGVQDWRRAAEFLDSKLSQYPDDYRLRYLSAIAHEEEGEQAEAVESFLALLKTDQEIPGLVASAPQTPWSGFLGPLTTLLPQDSVDYLELGWLTQLVYSHRRQNSAMRYTVGYRGLGQSSVTLPHDADSARKYALAHLITIAQTMNEDDSQALVDAMSRQGVLNAPILFEVPPSIGPGNNIAEAARKHPENEGMMGLYLLMNMDGRRFQIPGLASQAYALFKERRPQLALIAAAQAASQDKKHAALLDKAISALPEVEKPNLFMVMAISSILGGGQRLGVQPDAGPGNLSDEQRKKLTQQLLQWYPKLTTLGPQGLPLFMFVATAVSQSEAPGEYFAFLDAEVQRWRNSGRPAAQSMMMGPYGMPGEEAFLSPLEFPAKTLSDFPRHVRALLMPQRDGGPLARVQQPDRWDEEVLAKEVPKIKDPILRILIAHQYGQSDLVETTLDELLDAEQPQLDAFLLAAGKAASEGHTKQAMELLDKCRYLPMTRKVRTRLDAALVAMATEMEGMSEKPKSAPSGGVALALGALTRLLGGASKPSADSSLEIGRKAALRLRRANLQSEQRLQLVAALEQLGLSDEAEKLETSTAATLGGPSGGRPYARAAVQTDRASKLLGEGKRDQALRLLVNDVSAQARFALMGNNPYGSDSELQRLARLIRSHNLTEDVLAKLDPGESGNELRLGQFGVACEALGKGDEARDAYEAVLAKNGKNDGVRIRLAMLLAEEDSAAAAAELRKINPRNMQQVGQQIVASLNGGDEDLREKIQAAQTVHRYLQTLKNSDKIDLSWTTNLLDALGNPTYQRGASFPSLYARNVVQEQLEGAVAEINQLRRKTHDELARTMLNIPQLAPEAFTRLLAANEAEGEVADEFPKLALDAMLSHKPYSGPRNNPYGYRVYSSMYADSDEQRVPFRKPGEFLVRQAWKAGEVKRITDEVAPALQKAGKSKEAEQLLADLELYTCAEDDFLAQAEKHAARVQNRASFPPQGGEQEPAARVVEVWRERGLDSDLSPLLLGAMKKSLQSGNYWSPPAHVSSYVVELARRKQRDKVDALLERIAEMYLGPKDERKELIKKHYNQRSVSSGTANARIHGYVEMMQQMMRRRELMFPALDQLAEYGLGQGTGNIEWRMREEMFSSGEVSGENVVENIVDVLGESPFTADLEDLRVYPQSGGSRRTTMASVLFQLRGLDDGTSAKVKARFEAWQPATFGAGLIAAFLDESPAVAVLEFAAKYERKLKALSDDRQKELAALIEDLSAGDPSGSPDLSDGARRIRKWLAAVGAEERNRLLKKVLAAKRFEDLATDDLGSMESLTRLIPPLIHTDPDQAEAVFYKLVELLDEAQSRAAYSGGYYGGGDSAAARLVVEIVQASPDLATLAFALDRIAPREEDRQPLEWSRWYRDSLDAPVVSAFDSARRSLAGDEQRPALAALKKLYMDLGKNLGNRPTTILAGAYLSIAGRLSEKDRETAVAWADAEADEGDHPEIARELAAACRMAQAARRRPRTSNPSGEATRGSTADYHRHYLAVLKDRDLPPSWRLTVVEVLMQSEAKRLPAEIVLTAVDVYRETLDGKQRDGDRLAALLSAFLSLKQDADWKARATALAESWQRSMLKSAPSRSRYGMSINPTEVVAMLKLNLLLGNEQNTAQILQRFDQHLADNLDAFVLLVRHGRNALAAKILRAGKLHPQRGVGLANRYDRKLHAALPAFLESLPQQDLRYQAEVLLASLPDVEDEQQRAEVEHGARLKDVAGRFAEIEFTGPAAKERVLSLLCQNEEAAALVAQPLAELAGGMRLKDVLLSEDQQLIQRRQTLIMTHLRQRARAGDCKPLSQTLDDLSDPDFEEPYSLSRTKAAIATMLFELLAENGSKWSEEPTSELLAVTRKVLEGGADRYGGRNRAGGAAIVIAIHAAAGKMNEFDAWWESLTDAERSAFHSAGVDDGVWDQTAKFAAARDESDLTHRLELAARILHSADKQGWIECSSDGAVQHSVRTSRLGSAIVASNLLSGAELLEHGGELAKAAPAGGLVWAMIADRQAQERKFEAAAESWRKAVDAAPQDDALRQTRWRMKQAAVLHKLKRDNEARAVLEELDRKRIDPQSRQQFDAQLEQLKSAPPEDGASLPGEPMRMERRRRAVAVRRHACVFSRPA